MNQNQSTEQFLLNTESLFPGRKSDGNSITDNTNEQMQGSVEKNIFGPEQIEIEIDIQHETSFVQDERKAS